MAASMRKDSVNKKLAQVAHKHLSESSAQTELLNFEDFEAPNYNGDVEETKPAGVQSFFEKLTESDGLVLVTPEYNYSMPGNFKNLFDWISRYRPQPWSGKQVLLMSASPSGVGGNRALYQLQVPFSGCGSFVYPNFFSLASAYSAFEGTGLADEKTDQRLQDTLKGFTKTVQQSL